MKWSLAWLVMLSALSGGCQTATNSCDPFSIYGPRLVPPPGTGTLGQQPGGYYQGPVAPAMGAPLSTGQRLLPVPSLNSQPRAANAGTPRTSGHWVPADGELARSPKRSNREVVQAGGPLRPSDSLPWRTPDSVRGGVQRASGVAAITGPYDPRPLPAPYPSQLPQTLSSQGLTEITELPRPLRSRQNGIPSAAVFPALSRDPNIAPVMYDQSSYDYGEVDQAIAYVDPAGPLWGGDAYSYPMADYSDQPAYYTDASGRQLDASARSGGGVVSTSVRSDAWRQRR